MELAIAILANVALGVLLLGLFAGLRRPDAPPLAGADDALAIFRRRFPDAFGAATVASDGRGALLTLRSEIGLLHLHGRRWNACKLARGELSAVSITREDTITLALADFGWPRAHIRIADPDARAAWYARLTGLLAAEAAQILR